MLLHHLYGHLASECRMGGYWQERTVKVLRYHFNDNAWLMKKSERRWDFKSPDMKCVSK